MTATGFSRPTALLVIALAVLCALLLALPGETVTTKYVNDLFVFLDGAHRIDQGQIPNRDFHTALGPLTYYIPALGLWLSGTMGGAMPVGMALLLVALAPAAAWILGSRLRPAIGIPLAVYLVLVLAVPANLGESIAALSFAMFYNRIGWTALGLLLVLYLPPRHAQAGQPVLDGLCASGLVLLMLYTKISYGAVGIGFLVFLLLDPRQRGWAAGALAGIAAACLAIEFVWRGSVSHITDIMMAGRVSGGLGTPDRVLEILLRNLADYILFAIFVVLALARTRGFRDFLFFGFCAGSGFVLIAQNFQHWGIVTLGAGAAVGAEILARRDGVPGQRQSAFAGINLVLLGLVLPSIAHLSATLLLHAGLAASHRGASVPLPKFEGIRLVQLWHGGDHPAFSRYLASIEDGARALEDIQGSPARVLVLDFVSPFAAGLGLRPVAGDNTWHHWGRTIDETHFPPPERLFQDATVVLEPKFPIEAWTANGMREVYAETLQSRYRLSHETADWKVYVAQPEPAETVSNSDGSPDTPPATGSAGGG
ncbi:MAG TPA: hypothetical protein VIL09_03895 [Microvirga sp.]|jgi:hypothetical protein